MKNNFRKIISFILILSFALILSGCGKKVNLSFEVNGGTQISAVTLEKNSEYTLPTPIKEGYSFEGWYLSSDFSGDSVTSITVSSNTTVYAKWAELYAINLNLDGGSLDKTVIYAKAGDNVYDLVKDLTPTKSGLVFGSWFNGNQ